MKARSGLLTLGYVLAGVLAICGLMLTLARRAGRSEPSIGSYGPSGLRLFAELLIDEGYRLDATRDATPRLDPKTDVAVAVFVERGFNLAQGMPTPLELEAELTKFAESGGRILWSSLGSDFESVTRVANQRELLSPYTEHEYTIEGEFQGRSPAAWVQPEPRGTSILLDGANPWMAISAIGKGKGLYVGDFSGATNRFLERAQNAAALVSAVRAIAPPGSRLVFLEAAWGNESEPGLFESIGDWAAAGWAQFLVLCLVVAYTLGKPFGIPESKRPPQRGQRDLVDAYGMVLRRARATPIALEAIRDEADRRVRRALKMDMGLERAERDKRIPPELASLFQRVDAAIRDDAPPDIALGLAEKLDEVVSAFAGDRRAPSRRHRKS